MCYNINAITYDNNSDISMYYDNGNTRFSCFYNLITV